MKYTFLIFLISLTACAHDNYQKLSMSSEQKKLDLRSCGKYATDTYFDKQNTNLILVSGIAGGAIGGVIGGAAIGSGLATSDNSKISDINKNIDSCMYSKGYTGNSL